MNVNKKQKMLLSRGSFLFFAFASSHETGKNSHHHFVIDFHQIFRKSVNPSTNLTSHGNGIFSIWKKILKQKKVDNIFYLTGKEGKDEKKIWYVENQRNVGTIIAHYWQRTNRKYEQDMWVILKLIIKTRVIHWPHLMMVR